MRLITTGSGETGNAGRIRQDALRSWTPGCGVQVGLLGGSSTRGLFCEVSAQRHEDVVRVEVVGGPGRPITIEVQGTAERAGQVALTGEGVVMVVGQDADDRGGLGQHRPVFGAGEQVPVLAGRVWAEDLLPRLPPFREVGV